MCTQGTAIHRLKPDGFPGTGQIQHGVQLSPRHPQFKPHALFLAFTALQFGILGTASAEMPEPPANPVAAANQPSARSSISRPAYAKRFTGKYECRLISGGIGHNLPQEAPAAFAKAVIDAAPL